MKALQVEAPGGAPGNEHEIIKAFFQTDSASEIINSLTFMTESLLCAENVENISLEMRMHIVNQNRVINLISKLGENYR
jgi:adenosylmethionine-8-amino-7-oxononanoate aminotransferase